jgi:hypothetical protein
MKIAHIVPTKFADALLSKHSYFLALAHLVVEDSEYASWYQKQSAAGKYVILDNGLEEGQCMEMDSILAAADRIHAAEIVLPDVWKDGPISTAVSLRALEHPLLKESSVKIAAVVQGKDRASWIASFDELRKDPRIHTLMIPKNLDEGWGYGGRFAACAYLSATSRIDKEHEYHLLGVWTDPIEVYLHAHYNKWIRGLDTALAFQAGYQEVSLSYLVREGGHKPKRPHSYFSINQITGIQSALVRTNIELLDKWGNGHA